MKNLFELKQAQKAALDKAEALLGANDHVMTPAENEGYTAAMADFNAIGETIKKRESINTIRNTFANGQPIVEEPQANTERPAYLTAKYRTALAAWLKSNGQVASAELKAGYDEKGGFKFAGVAPSRSAASYEGGATSGAPLYQIAPVDTNIIALAPPEMGIAKLSLVIPTSMDLPMSRKTGFGVANTKAEGDGTGTNLFQYTQSPTTEKFTLGAHMIGHPEDASWELLQDVNTFQQFLVDDILLSLAILKENAFWGGNADGIQGIKGNIGAGVAAVAATSASYGPLLDATFDVMGDLNVYYYPNAAFLMNRATAIGIRKAQKQANLFEPVFVRVNGQDTLHGFPVEYSSAVDAVPAAGTTGKVPVVFGDFKRGYVIGERGGSGVNVKILDQPKALEGLLTILGYQRVDGKIRRSEALQPITLA